MDAPKLQRDASAIVQRIRKATIGPKMKFDDVLFSAL